MMNNEIKLNVVKEIKKDDKVLEFVAITMQERDDVLKKLDAIKFYIEQSDVKNMLWGKEILKIIGDNDD